MKIVIEFEFAEVVVLCKILSAYAMKTHDYDMKASAIRLQERAAASAQSAITQAIGDTLSFPPANEPRHDR